MYLRPDTTGENPRYRSQNNIKTIFKTGQVAQFGRPVFKRNINITLLGTPNRIMLEGVDWVINPSDIDEEAMSMMKNQEPTFNDTLIRSVTMVKNIPETSPIKVNYDYQMLYELYSEAALFNGEPVKFSPNVLVDILKKLSYHDTILSPLKEAVASEVSNAKLLEPDPYLEKIENKLEAEEHEMDVPNGIHYIYPLAGSFFRNTLVVRAQSPTTVPLVENVDYVIFGVDHPKTRMTNHKGGVYNFILILKPIVGPVFIDYHAFGGEVTQYDHREIQKQLLNIVNFLNNAQHLTPETVGSVPTFVELNLRLTELEETVRRLSNSGRPSYGDLNRKCIVKKIISTDNELHWYTIASLYKVDGSPDEIFIADRMHLRVQTVYSKFMFDAYVSVDLANKSNVLNVGIVPGSDLYPKGYIPFQSYDVDSIIRPQFRIIWNENTVQTSGIFLQIGFELKQLAEETIAIEDLSGIESCWKLVDETIEAVSPEDSVIELPDGDSVWDIDTNPDSRVKSCLIPFTDGYLVWAGTFSLNRPNLGRKEFNIEHYLDKQVDITTFKKIRLDFMEQGGITFSKTIDFIPGTENPFGIEYFNYNGQDIYVSFEIKRDTITNEIKMQMTSDVNAATESNQLDLRHVVIFV